MLNCNGLLRIPNQHGLSRSKWKDGFYLSFAAISVEGGKKHYYRCNMFVPADEIKEWEKNIKPGSIFLLKNAGLSSYREEGWKNSIFTVKINRRDFKYLRVRPIGEKNE